MSLQRHTEQWLHGERTNPFLERASTRRSVARHARQQGDTAAERNHACVAVTPRRRASSRRRGGAHPGRGVVQNTQHDMPCSAKALTARARAAGALAQLPVPPRRKARTRPPSRAGAARAGGHSPPAWSARGGRRPPPHSGAEGRPRVAMAGSLPALQALRGGGWRRAASTREACFAASAAQGSEARPAQSLDARHGVQQRPNGQGLQGGRLQPGYRPWQRA
jgi:hypothetical protein